MEQFHLLPLPNVASQHMWLLFQEGPMTLRTNFLRVKREREESQGDQEPVACFAVGPNLVVCLYTAFLLNEDTNWLTHNSPVDRLG